jgi:HPt (histidine-containing phosphotransfer) domain-containing protein
MTKKTDLTFLTSFTGGNPDKMKKYIKMFLDNCPKQLILMNDHLQNGNLDGLRGTAHALKPQIIYMGIQNGEALIKNIENLAGTKTDVEKLPEMLQNFNSLCEQAMAELTEEVQ